MQVQKAGLPELLQGREEEDAERGHVPFQGSMNDQCLPKQYKVKKVKEIWGVRCASSVY